MDKSSLLGLSKIINIFKYMLIISEYDNTIWHGHIHHPSTYHWPQYDACIWLYSSNVNSGVNVKSYVFSQQNIHAFSTIEW